MSSLIMVVLYFSRGTYFDFALVYPDLRTGNRYISRDIGTTVAGQKVSLKKETQFCKFQGYLGWVALILFSVKCYRKIQAES